MSSLFGAPTVPAVSPRTKLSRSL
ncbi:unnamed protein product [Staurois parvus]|uniref:Uncharacterized protein n=1 Tax=Staurois parvus TaxID=386267 RepID=A0ABN9F1B8_9NEOB|nr:unnamed protein product [Staurois parvus]